MKKVLVLLLTGCIFLSSSNIVVADEIVSQNEKVEATHIQELEQKIENIRIELALNNHNQANYSFEEQQSVMKQLGDTIYDLNLLKWNVVHIDNVYTKKSIVSPEGIEKNSGLQVFSGDIILIKPKQWTVPWSPFVGSVSHAAMIIDDTHVIEIPDQSSVVRKLDFTSFMNQHRYTSDQIIIISMWLNDYQWRMISQYAKNFIWRPYPTWYEFPRSKYWFHKFYCSSLVWRAHMSSGKYIDLDDYNKNIIYPVELDFSVNTGIVNIIQL